MQKFQESNKVRVRFAPSPTGKLHIGGARTAIFNWAYARAHDGDFILRIEDTDPERSTAENVRIILDSLRWLGLEWDEGPEVGGAKGPYFQTQRAATYTEALETLKERNAVYPCFCTKEKLDAQRKRAQESEGGFSGYDRTCRTLDPAEAQARIEAGEAHVWRLAVPEDHGPITFTDAVYGPVRFEADVLDDMILIRSDGTPTYNFAVVCDDANMGITHVIRGDDHLSNTPRQILIYEALGFSVPTFAHLSMILGPDNKKLSKRHGATSVTEYRDQGYLPDAVVNFLALLGWSLDGETTIIDRATLCRSFDLNRITKKDALFDVTKLDWMNGVYIRALDAQTWVDLARPWLIETVAQGRAAKSGITIVCTANPSEPNAIQPEPLEIPPQVKHDATTFVETHATWLEQLFPLVAERLVRLNEIPEKLAFLFWGPNVRLDEKSMRKVLLKKNARADEALAACRDVLATAKTWKAADLQESCRALCETLDMKPRNLFQPLRVAICGNMVSPPLFESIELLTRSDVLTRIDLVLSAMADA